VVLVFAMLAATAVALSSPASAAGTYQVTIAVPSQSPMAGAPFVISGTVSPAAAGAPVRLQRFYGGRFHTVAKGQLDASSSYSFAQVFGTVGGRTFRVAKPADKAVGKGFSPMRRVFVTGSSVSSSVLLKAGNTLISSKGTYSLTMLGTGDVVMTLNSTGRVIWSFGTAGHPGATAVLQRDGNFVVHDAHGAVVKSTRSGGHPSGSYSLTLREDSDLWIYTPSGHRIWSSYTTNDLLRANESLHAIQFLRSSDRRYQLLMQRTGDLVLYDTSNGSKVWDTGTAAPNSRVIMGPGGSMTVYGPLGKELWSTHTNGYPGAYARLETNGDLVIYHKGVALWASQGIGGVLGDDYPESLRQAPRDSVIDPWRFYNRECTSFVAWRMNSTNHVDFQNFMAGGRFGSAYNWDDNARQLGYRVDNVPARGAIAESDREGHVAWVAAVGDGVVTIEDYNYTHPGEYGTRTVPTSQYIYIHIKDL
jgi:surface antigen